MAEARAKGTAPVEEAPRQRRPSRWHLPLWWMNALAVIVLLATYLAPHVPPSLFWPLAVLALTFPYQLALHACFLAYWLLFRRKRMLLSGIALLLGWGHIADHVQLLGAGTPPDDAMGAPVKLLTWNVRLFNLYDWEEDVHTHKGIFEVLRREDPDILCLQEYFESSDKRFFRTAEPLRTDFRFVARHAAWALVARTNQYFGIATFSARPIAGRGRVELPLKSGNICIWTDIALGADTVRVYNAHLASYHFGDADYRFIGTLNTETHADSIKLGGRRIMARLRAGAIRREREVRAIVAHMASSPHPAVFCGDINDVPMSYAYGLLSARLRDAFVESGSGLSGTYIGKLPRLRIDYILHDPRLAAWDYRRLPEELSDHHAVAARLAMRAAP
jgi:endonuclease/exonuclease/phosphatase family metal-dependent hydrolase